MGKTIYTFGMTDKGQRREQNEDTFILRKLWNDRYVLAAAIDGMGGYEGGEVAAAIARDGITTYLERHPEGERPELLKAAVVYANNEIVRRKREDPMRSQMGCVLTAILMDVQSGEVWMAHVGDSRLYQFADQKLTKLSHDMSLVGYREEKGLLTEEEAMNHPERSVIDRALGLQPLTGTSDYIETGRFTLADGEMMMLCSDGLCDMITSGKMAEILSGKDSTTGQATGESAEQFYIGENGTDKDQTEIRVRRLVQAANDAGGKDNITVVLIQSTETEPPEEKGYMPTIPFSDERVEVTEVVEVKQKEPKKEPWLDGKSALLAAILILLGIAIGYFLKQ